MDVLDRARAGDDQAFAELANAYRRELTLHCYRMLGSVTDAEDLVQETLLAAWRGLDGFAERSSLRAWLYRIATNRCLNAIRDRGRRPRAEPVPPFEAPPPSRRDGAPWLEPWLDPVEAHERVELAFVAALQRLPPRQTAALVLCDVLGFAPREAAEMLGSSGPHAVKGLLQRARAALAGEQVAASPPPQPGSPQERDLARRFARAFLGDDVSAVVALLTDDAWLAMPPAPHVYEGRDAVAAFLRASAAWRGDRPARLEPTRANGAPAFVYTMQGAPTGLIALTLAGDRVAGITRFLDVRAAHIVPA